MWETILDFLRDHLAKILSWAAGALAFGAWAWYLSYIAWKRREYLSRINYSLNSIRSDTLLIRTLLETSLAETFLNAHAVRLVRSAAQRTTKEDPILRLPKDDAWFILNAVLNELSEKFSAGLLRADVDGTHAKTARYVICLTCEKAGEVRTQKVRAMVIREDLLQSLPAEPPRFEQPHHAVRWTTLQKMKQEFHLHPASCSLMTVELSP